MLVHPLKVRASSPSACEPGLRSIVSALLAGAAVSLAAAPPATAGVTFGASVSPAVVSSPARISYALQMVNDGDAEERFAVALVSPTYGPSRAGDALPESNAVHQLGEPAIEGSGRLLGGYTHVAGLLAACSAAGAGGHGYGLDGVSFDIGLPARSTSTLRATYEAGLPFWPDLDLRMRFVLRPQLTTGKPGTLSREVKVLSPQPAITGPVAVHMTLKTTPASSLSSFTGRPPIHRGDAVAVAGRANPPVGGQRVELRWARIGTRSNVLERGSAGRPRVDARGTFRARWTPPRVGSYELWAAYKSQGEGLVSDDTCPRLVRVVRG